VKNTSSVKNNLPAWASALLQTLPGAPVVEPAPPDASEDARLRFGDLAVELCVEQKAHVDPVAAHAIIARSQGRLHPRIVVAKSTTATARDVLLANGIGYVDATGNAAIDVPGLHVRTGAASAYGSFGASEVIVAAPKPEPSPRLAGKAGLLAQALLLEPDRAWTLDALAERAGVSTALAHRVVARLEAVSVVSPTGRGPRKTRRLVAPGALLDLWAGEAVERGARRVPACALLRGDVVREISTRLAECKIPHAVTGVAAADRCAPFMTAILLYEVRVAAVQSPESIFKATGARSVDAGPNLLFIQGVDDAELRFRREDDGVWLASPTRTYLDALRDPRRGAEQAREYRRAVFGF
jgi:hypothetical protein